MDSHPRESSPRRALALALGLTLLFAGVEFVLGFVSGSLALISDAGHMTVDSTGLLLALFAALMARRPSDVRRSYGYARVEVLVVPLHVLLMIGLAAYIVFEAVQRFGDPPDIAATPVIITGAIGLAINLVVLRLLHGHSHDNLNVRGAVYEVLADALGSVGVIVSGAVILATGWTGVDVIVSLIIAALLVPRAFALLRQAVTILLEGTPHGFPVEQIERDARTVPGVEALHDLHVWSLAPSFIAVSAHVEVRDMRDSAHAIAAMTRLLTERYGVHHVTLQPETRELHDEMVICCIATDHVTPEWHDHEPTVVH